MAQSLSCNCPPGGSSDGLGSWTLFHSRKMLNCMSSRGLSGTSNLVYYFGILDERKQDLRCVDLEASKEKADVSL